MVSGDSNEENGKVLGGSPKSVPYIESVNLLIEQDGGNTRKSSNGSPIKNNDNNDNENQGEDEECNEKLLSCNVGNGNEKIVQVYTVKPLTISGKFSRESLKGGINEKLPVAKQQKGWKRLWGILFALVAALQFSLSALVIKILGYHPFNLGVWRFGVMCIIPIPFLIHATVVKKQKIFKEIWPVRSTTVFLMVCLVEIFLKI